MSDNLRPGPELVTVATDILGRNFYVVFPTAARLRSRSGHFPSLPDEPTGSLPPCGWRTGETCRSNTILHLTHGLFFLFQSRLQTDLAQAISCTVGSCSLRTRNFQLNVDEKTFANTASGSANPDVTRSAAHSVKAGNVTTR